MHSMESVQTQNSGFFSKLFNVVSDPAVQFSAGNTCLFWSGGGVPQIASVTALVTNLSLKTYSEFSDSALNVFNDPNLPLKVASAALGVVAVNAGLNGDFIPATISSVFALGNLSLAGALNGVKNKLSNVFGRVAAQVATQAETYFTAGMGMVAYLAAGDSAVALPFLDQSVPLSTFTFIPTAIGGALSVRNAITGQDNKSKPFLWLAGGLGATAGAGYIGGAILPAIANAFYASANTKIHCEIETSAKAITFAVNDNGKALLQKTL
jgi:hypothetical protein